MTSTATELNLLDGVTSTTAELNILDGVTSTAAELNILDGVTSTATELNLLDGVTSTTAELNILDGVTSTAAELNILDGVTASATDINLIDGITNGTVIASKAIITDSNKDITGGRNITISGELDAATLDISGNIDVDGTANLDVVDIDGALTQDGGAVFNEASADVDFRVESNGNANMLFVDGGNDAVNIGTTDSTFGLNVGGSGSDIRGKFQGSNQYRLSLQNGTANQVYLGSGGANNFRISNNSGSTLLELTSASNILLPTANAGIYLGVTSEVASNLLHDYEEGTWTAVAADASGNLGTTDSRGKYVKIGSLVYVSFLLPNINTTGMQSSAKFEVRGLPFTVNDSNYGMGSMFFSNINLSTATNVTLSPAAEVNTTRIRFFESKDNGTFVEITSTAIADDTADIHACSISYFTNS